MLGPWPTRREALNLPPGSHSVCQDHPGGPLGLAQQQMDCSEEVLQPQLALPGSSQPEAARGRCEPARRVCACANVLPLGRRSLCGGGEKIPERSQNVPKENSFCLGAHGAVESGKRRWGSGEGPGTLVQSPELWVSLPSSGLKSHICHPEVTGSVFRHPFSCSQP